MSTPVFVVVGAVNRGTSSIVSTLAENDTVAIDTQPGTTRESQSFTFTLDGQPAPGISLEIAEYQNEATSLYFDSGVISNTVKETDATGVGGFIRIPPGFVEITGLDRSAVPVGEVGVQANANFATYTVLVPTASP